MRMSLNATGRNDLFTRGLKRFPLVDIARCHTGTIKPACMVLAARRLERGANKSPRLCLVTVTMISVVSVEGVRG